MFGNKTQRIIGSIIGFRLISWLLVRTYFIADEYWQSFEIAHRLAFNYGYQTWEWRSDVAIRSYFYPYTISLIYRLLALLNLDTVPMMIHCATLFQTFLGILGDLTFLKFLQGHRLTFLIVLCRLTCWYTIYSSPRLLINNVEEILFIFSLTAAKKFRASTSNPSFHFFVSLSFILRPTSIIPFVLIYPFLLYKSINRFRFLAQAALYFILLNLLNTLLDSYFYDRWTFVPWNFFYMNFLHPNSISSHYGIHHVFWYFVNGLPMIFFYRFPLVLLGAMFNKRLTSIVVFTMFIYSLSPHKEFRFLSQILPIVFVIEAHGIDWCLRRIRSTKFLWILIVACFGHLFIGIYFSTMDRQGQISVMDYLRKTLPSKSDSPLSIDFLMPCHSTPFHNFIHRPDVQLNFLTCEPNLNRSMTHYLDEADQFYLNPIENLRKRFSKSQASHLVMFNTLYDQLKPMFDTELPFDVKKILFNSHIQHTSRHGRMIYVLQRRF